MKQTRMFEIENKVFTKDNLRTLWKAINIERKPSSSEMGSNNTHLALNCVDGSTYESEEDNLLNDGDIVDLKGCLWVNMSYSDSASEKRIDLTLVQGDYKNKLIVVGKEPDWVSGVFDRLTNIIKSVRPQEHWFKRFRLLFLGLSATSFGFLFLNLITYLYGSDLVNFQNKQNIPSLLMTFVLGAVISYFVIIWIESLWPNVEFDFGPEHGKVLKNRRKRLGTFFSLLLLPILIEVILRLLE